MYNSILFNGFDILTLDGVTLFNHNFNNLPKRDIKINKLARQNKSIITSSEYSEKEITILLKVNKNCRQNTENALTNLKAALQAQNATLTVQQGTSTINYTVTMNEFNIEWMIPNAIVSIVFIASDPIGYNTVSQELLDINITSALINTSIQINGSAEVSPLFVLTVNSVTDGTNKSISLLNSSTYQGITITRTWVANDVLIIDGSELTVTLNDEIIDFSGMFPIFSAGAQQITYADDFTARNIDLVSTYYSKLV